LDEATASTVVDLLLALHQQQQSILIVVTHSSKVASRFPLRFELSRGQLQRVSS